MNIKRAATPNPDIMCNQEVKFKIFLEASLAAGADYIATGHYARVAHESSSSAKLLRARDDNKDQTYFLYRVTSEALSKTIFPLGDLLRRKFVKWRKSVVCGRLAKRNQWEFVLLGKLEFVSFCRNMLKLRQEYH